MIRVAYTLTIGIPLSILLMTLGLFFCVTIVLRRRTWPHLSVGHGNSAVTGAFASYATESMTSPTVPALPVAFSNATSA